MLACFMDEVRLEWTGERCLPWGDEVQGIYEHLHRYEFASRFVAGKRVLDLASGEGYGAAILARQAALVVGVELDAEAVAHSRTSYSRPNLTFEHGSMLDLGAHDDGAFDAVVCYEAIEHIEEQRDLVGQVDRVLAHEGVFITSTPDRETYNASIHEANPFHVRELSQAELLDLLRPPFEHVALWGQNGIGGSRLYPLGEGAADVPTREQIVVRRDEDWLTLEEAQPMYLVATASHVPLAAEPGRSYLIDTTAEALRERDRRVSTRDERIRELKAQNAALYRENERLRKSSLAGQLRRVKGLLRKPQSR
jgi:SAM-dependent methyltransferase